MTVEAEAEAGWNWAPLMQRQREKNGAKVGLGVLAAETGAAEEITGKEWEVGITEDCSAAHRDSASLLTGVPVEGGLAPTQAWRNSKTASWTLSRMDILASDSEACHSETGWPGFLK